LAQDILPQAIEISSLLSATNFIVCAEGDVQLFVDWVSSVRSLESDN